MKRTATGRISYAKDKKSNIVLYDFLATGLVPEAVIRIGIKRMLRQKLRDLKVNDSTELRQRTRRFAEELKSYPIAIETDSANTQHYEVPPEFFELILGPNMKYSCCLYEDGDELKDAEERMLEVTCQRAALHDGQRILDLGCGWGSFTIYAATKYPKSKITAVSNSRSQTQFIEQRARKQNLTNIVVVTGDVNHLQFPAGSFDRIVSVEMFEHAKNYQMLLENISTWLREDGKLFVHIFSHLLHQYHYGESEDDWLARYFFTGGTMPSHSLLFEFNEHLRVSECWQVNGTHYQRTAEAWLENMSSNRDKLMDIIATTYGTEQAKRWWVYWRLFFLACAELWGYGGGNQWIVSHYRFEKAFTRQD
ncbi:MAG: cyclopropane-fatty-acyl-phospholipid synthase family protein [Cyanobacteria bacterium]|nr:cyclopropane-fatty-acyl-phospholipid synthase family protein [Cyanobacteriota bacterium]